MLRLLPRQWRRKGRAGDEMLNRQELKDVALSCGADAVGVGSMDRFEGAPPEMDPRRMFPTAKSVIGMIFRIPRGYIRGIEEGTQFFQYPALGYAAINEDFAPSVLYAVGKHIEDRGYEAMVYRNTGGRGSVSDMTGKRQFEESPEVAGRSVRFSRPAKPGQPEPDIQIHFRIAAFICGLGEIGWSKMFLTPDFGPLNRQAFIFTDAEIEPDPLYDGEPLCNRCMACVAHCPGKCLPREEAVRVTVAGRELSWAKLDEWSCFSYYKGANRASNPFLPENAYEGIPDGDRIIKGECPVDAEGFRRLAPVIKKTYPSPPCGYNPPKCGGCLRACLSMMEKRGILRKKFVNRFRTAKPWKAC